MERAKLSKNFTEGNIARQLLLLSLPFMASNALQVLYSTIDMIIVGHYVGTPGLSAVSQSSQIVNFATMLCLGFSNAGQVLIAEESRTHKVWEDSFSRNHRRIFLKYPHISQKIRLAYEKIYSS